MKLPYMPLWANDIDTDRDCRKMSDAQFGRYMRLLIRQWIEGSVPVTPAECIRDAMLDSDAEGDIQSLLDRKFGAKIESGRGNPKLNEVRLETLEKCLENRERASRAGRASAAARGSTSSSTTSSTSSQPRASDSVSDSDSGSPKKKKDDEEFEVFWKQVPNKIGKGAARTAYAKAIKGGATHDEILAGVESYRQYEAKREKQQDYRPLHPATWLNQERWADEVSSTPQQQPLKSMIRSDV